MSVEALQGTTESFDPFFAAVRPHPGQMESARNINSFLVGSRLTAIKDGSEGTLRQDRYSIRTASQWLGPCLEDLSLAHQQITIESNSVTDNPLCDTNGNFLHGGNFQAKAVTSAMEKTRLCLQSLGQMLFTQCTELINPATNRGLPSNLVADEPGESFIFKAVDLMAAALQSELGFLSNPVGTYVQPAEMGNQALNSLALISARYTHTAVDVLSQLAAGHLMALCQALDLRAIHTRFLDDFQHAFQMCLQDSFCLLIDKANLASLAEILWKKFDKFFSQNMMMDSKRRIQAAVDVLQITIMDTIPTEALSIKVLKSWGANCTAAAHLSYATSRETYIAHPDTTHLLGRAAKKMYIFVRHDLGVPFLLTKMLLDAETQSAMYFSLSAANSSVSGCPHETAPFVNGETQQGPLASKHKLDDAEDQGSNKRISTRSCRDPYGSNDTVGSLIGKIHCAIRNGRLLAPLMACLQESPEEALSLDQNSKDVC